MNKAQKRQVRGKRNPRKAAPFSPGNPIIQPAPKSGCGCGGTPRVKRSR